MQAAPSPRRKTAIAKRGVAPMRAAPQPEAVPITLAELDAARQEYLDALPIAAAVLIVDAGWYDADRDRQRSFPRHGALG